MNYYLFKLVKGQNFEEAQNELENIGLSDIFMIEDHSIDEVLLGGHSKQPISTTKLEKTILIEEKKQAAVDWHEQWALFAEDFREGYAHIDLTPFGSDKTLLLTPGAGFGDLSHPTTHLMLEMMKGRMKEEWIIDVGTGSGILALAALKLGAQLAYGIDIENEALEHAKKNAQLNHLENEIIFSKTIPQRIKKNAVILMNMTFPEQKIIKPKKLNRYAKFLIISGILAQEKEDYLIQADQWGWEVLSQHTRAEWIGWVFGIRN